MSREQGIGGTAEQGPQFCGDATVEPIEGASLMPIPLRVSGVRSQRGPSSAASTRPIGDATGRDCRRPPT